MSIDRISLIIIMMFIMLLLFFVKEGVFLPTQKYVVKWWRSIKNYAIVVVIFNMFIYVWFLHTSLGMLIDKRGWRLFLRACVESHIRTFSLISIWFYRWMNEWFFDFIMVVGCIIAPEIFRYFVVITRVMIIIKSTV